MQIVSFSGLAQAGKTIAVDEMAKWCLNNGYTPRRMSFAGPLKKAADAIGAPKGGPRDPLYRKFCQFVGTDMCRNPDFVPGITGPTYWTEIMAENIQKAQAEELAADGKFHEIVILIDDARFEQELELIKKFSGVMVFLDRKDELPDINSQWRKHESERLCYEVIEGKHPGLFDHFIFSGNTQDNYRAMIRRMAPIWVRQIAELNT